MRAVVAIVLVVGLLFAVVGLEAKHPPTRNIAIPIYLGDPDDEVCARPRGDWDTEISLDRKIGDRCITQSRMFSVTWYIVWPELNGSNHLFGVGVKLFQVMVIGAWSRYGG